MALEAEDREAIVRAIRDGFEAARTSTTGQTPNTSSNFGPDRVEAAAGSLASVINRGGGSIENAVDAFGGAVLPNTRLFRSLTGGLGSVIGYLEETQSVFQNLSNVGAGFNGNLGELRTAAGQTRLPLDQFANLVGNNATQLTALGGSVNEGAKYFAQLSNVMFEEGMIDGFMNLGMSIEEANEFVLRNTELTRRQARLTNMTEEQQVTAAQNLAKELTTIAKLTGKEASQLQDQLIERQRDGATQARLRLLERQGVTNAQEAYTAAQSALSSAPAVVGDLMDDLLQTGAPMSEATRNFAATNQEAYGLLQKAAEANKRGDVEAAQRYAEEAAAATARFADSEAGLTLATYAQISEVAQGQANVLEEMGPVIDAVKANMDGIEDISEAFLNNLRRLRDETATQVEGDLPGQQALEAVNDAQIALADFAGEMNEMLGTHINTNNLLIEAYAQVSQQLGGLTSTGMTQFVEGIESLIPGTSLPERIGELESQLPNLIESGDITQEQFDNLIKLLDPTTTTSEQEALAQALEQQDILQEGTLALTDALVDALQEARSADVQELEESGQLEPGRSVLDWLMGLFPGSSDPERNEGSPGLGTSNPFENFGSGQAIIAHGLESIVPAGSPQGALLSAFPNGLQDVQNMMNNIGARFDPSAMQELANQVAATGAPLTEAAQQAMTSMSTPNTSRMGTTSEDSLDNLNQTVLQLVEINRRMHDIASRQLRATRSLDGNLLQGLGA